MMDPSYIEAFGHVLEHNGAGSVSYVFANTVYTIEPEDDGEDTVITRPATNDDLIAAGIKRSVPCAPYWEHDYEGALLPDYYE